MKDNHQISSVLNNVSSRVFNAKTLEEAKNIMRECLTASNIDEKDKQTMLKTLETKKTLPALHKYFTDCLLKFEGLGVI